MRKRDLTVLLSALLSLFYQFIYGFLVKKKWDNMFQFGSLLYWFMGFSSIQFQKNDRFTIIHNRLYFVRSSFVSYVYFTC